MKREEFDAIVKELETALDKNGDHLRMASVIVSENNVYYSHYFMEPEAIDVRSIAKTVVCLALGAAIEQGLYFDGIKIGLETPIWQFLSKYSEIADPENLKRWEKVTLMDCLRITLGHDKGLITSSDVKEHGENDLVNHIVNYPVTREVGKDFTYSNAGTYLISSLITEYLDQDLGEFVSELIFSPLGITGCSWKKYGKYCAGCTGLKMKNEDLHKIGRLLLDDGVYAGRQVVPSNWIEKMRTPQVPSPTHRYIPTRAFPKWSYGMNLWICEDGIYYCDGTDGQYLIINAKKNMVITAMGYQPDTEPTSRILGMLK